MKRQTINDLGQVIATEVLPTIEAKTAQSEEQIRDEIKAALELHIRPLVAKLCERGFDVLAFCTVRAKKEL